MIELTARIDRFPTAGSWTISRGTVTEVIVVTVTARDGDHSGHGECRPYPRYDETPEGVIGEIEGLAGRIGEGFDLAALQTAMPSGAARNAVDCALWDLMAKRTGKRVWELAGLPVPHPEITAYSLSLDTPDAMEKKAAENTNKPLLKVKLGGDGDLDRLRAVRRGAPDARIIIDANEGWDLATYRELAPVIVNLGIEMVEQPLPAASDDPLMGADRPLPVCADEAAHDRASLAALKGKYDMVNIKLDKTGGLTEALAMKREAEAMGFAIMVGCMLASSLAMAPAVLVAQGAAITDLDGPLLLSEDRLNGLTYDAAGVHPSAPELWG